MTRRPCIEPGCNLIGDPGESRCRAHRRARAHTRNQTRRAKAHPSRGAAALLRAAINQAGAGTCAQCHGHHPSRHIDIDHITPLADGGNDTTANVQPLCHTCHVTKTTSEQRQRRTNN